MAVMNSLRRRKMAGNVFCFLPNIIGYVRIIFALISFYYMPFEPYKAVCFYLISEVMDALDGYVARSFSQSSSFGAVLDMLTDRLCTVGLLLVLATLTPEKAFVYQFIAVLDIFSHWFQMYSSLLYGKKSHKDSTHTILNIYYSNKVILFVTHGGCELFLIGCYLQYYSVGPLVSVLGYDKGVWELLSLMCLPLFLIKQSVHVLQLINASELIANLDTRKALELEIRN